MPKSSIEAKERFYWQGDFYSRLRVVPHFSLAIVERSKCVSPFIAWGDFHERLRFAHSTIPEEKWGTTRSLLLFPLYSAISQVTFTQTKAKVSAI